jgi:cyclopropane fatty-acyl-phospholipid synthase-like methyltransferase
MLKVVERSWNEFWAYFWRVRDRHNIPGIAEWDRRLVAFVEHVCQLEPPARILDLACGGGDQAKILAEKGYEMVGIDIAPSLVEYARRQLKESGLSGDFVVRDMRAIDYDGEFDACVILSGSFGLFGEVADTRLLCSIHKALKKGGKVFIMFVSAHQQPAHSREWKEMKDGWQLTEHWFDAETSIRYGTVFIIQKDGTIIVPKKEPGYHANEGIHCYTIPEMKKMFSDAGLEFLASYSDRHLEMPLEPLPREALRNIVVGQRPPKS